MANPKGVANVTRQTWDREQYEELAKLRASGQVDEDADKAPKKIVHSNRQEFAAAEDGAAGPRGSARAFLHARSERVGLEEKAGSVRVVKGDDAAKTTGYYCEVCECTLKDSVAYLDHINGKRHLRKLGFSMRVERSTVDQVKDRLQAAAKRKYDPVLTKKLDAMEEYERKRAEIEEEEARRKRQKKEERQARRKQQKHEETSASDADTATETKEEVAATDDNDMMAMMGFAGFGGSKKS